MFLNYNSVDNIQLAKLCL